MHAAPLLLQPSVQHYDWGRAASESVIADLLSEYAGCQKPLAELWLGAHPKAPARIVETGQTLDAYLQESPAVLGKAIEERFGASLPFLFKILSVGRPLSIQLHPDEKTAKRLHAADPEHYPDANPKPEIGVALSEVELLYGFRSIESIRHTLQSVPRLQRVLADHLDSLASAFAAVYALEPDDLKDCCDALAGYAAGSTCPEADAYWIKTLCALYPEADVGILAYLFLNLVRVQPGQGVFIDANIPHAYLRGELIECMANSDNVIRAGLTSKFRDTATLLELADYSAAAPQRIKASRSDSESWEYFQTPASSFSLLRSASVSCLRCEASPAASLLFCSAGESVLTTGGTELSLLAGQGAFIPAGSPALEVTLKDAQVYWVKYPGL